MILSLLDFHTSPNFLVSYYRTEEIVEEQSVSQSQSKNKEVSFKNNRGRSLLDKAEGLKFLKDIEIKEII